MEISVKSTSNFPALNSRYQWGLSYKINYQFGHINYTFPYSICDQTYPYLVLNRATLVLKWATLVLNSSVGLNLIRMV